MIIMPTTLSQSIQLQMRVIKALLMREILTRYGRENIGFLWIIGEPILFCGGVAILWTLIRPAHEHGIPVTAFVVTGYVPLTMWRHCVGRAVKAFEANGALLFHRQVTPFDIITSRCVLEVVGTLMAGIIVMFGAFFLGFMNLPVDVPILLVGTAYHITFCYASALIISAASEYSDLVEKVVSVVMYLSIPFSGTFTMVDWMPKQFQEILLWSPSVHNLEMIRSGQFGPTVHAHYDLFFDTWSTSLMCLIGLLLTLQVRSRITVQ
jgi:capsular polysaccharide transport system permease protein